MIETQMRVKKELVFPHPNASEIIREEYSNLLEIMLKIETIA